jgi:hypothetical protein
MIIRIIKLTSVLAMLLPYSLSAVSPCDDSLYNSLKTKGIDSLSDREYQYFLNKDMVCNEYFLSQSKAKEMPASVNGCTGRLQVFVDNDDVGVYVNEKIHGNGDQKIELPCGTHRITVRDGKSTKSEIVHIFENDNQELIINLGFIRKVRFTMSFDAAWMLGKNVEFGPSHSFGFKIFDKHYVGLNYYWGIGIWDDAYIFGGGLTYTHAFNVKNIFIAEYGAIAGFWYEYEYNNDYYGSSYYYNNDTNNGEEENFYFGGPKVRLRIGYKYVYFMLEPTLLIGPGNFKAALNSGFSFIF